MKSNKLNVYVVCVINRGQKGIEEGTQYFMEYDNIEEVVEELKFLKLNGQNMDYVTVFPKGTGVIGTNFFIKLKED